VNVRGKIKHEGPGNDYTFDFDDPEGNRLQFFSDMDRIGWDGKSGRRRVEELRGHD